jgi:hypothetical protein
VRAGGRRSAVLCVATVGALGALYFATSASGHCATLIADCFSRCSGPAPHGIYCSAGEIGESLLENPVDSWTVPAEVKEAKFVVRGGDDPSGGRGGRVAATLAVVPGETLALELGIRGGASFVSREGAHLLAAAGGNGLEPSYVTPGAGAVTIEAPGQPNPPYPSNGSIDVSWYENQVTTPPPVECVVPSVLGKRPVVARRQLVKAHCRAGEIARRRARRANRGRVIGQRPMPGTVLSENARVDLTVGRWRG